MSNSRQVRVFIWGLLTLFFVVAGINASELFLFFAFLTGLLTIVLIVNPDKGEKRG